MGLIEDKLGFAPKLRDVLDSGKGDAQAVFALTGSVGNTDTTAKTLGTLPAGARIIDIILDVTTAFDGTGSNDVQVGDGSTDNHFGSNGVGSAGQTLTGWGTNFGADNGGDITAKYVDGGGDSSNGQAEVTVLYLAS